MATDAEIQAKKDKIAKMRAEKRDLAIARRAALAEESSKVRLDSLSAEEAKLEEELAALRAAAPKSAPAPAPAPKPSSSDAGSTKE